MAAISVASLYVYKVFFLITAQFAYKSPTCILLEIAVAVAGRCQTVRTLKQEKKSISCECEMEEKGDT